MILLIIFIVTITVVIAAFIFKMWIDCNTK